MCLEYDPTKHRRNSPEEGTLVSQFAVLIFHAFVDPLVEAQLLLRLVQCSVFPHQGETAYNTTQYVKHF